MNVNFPTIYRDDIGEIRLDIDFTGSGEDLKIVSAKDADTGATVDLTMNEDADFRLAEWEREIECARESAREWRYEDTL